MLPIFPSNLGYSYNLTDLFSMIISLLTVTNDYMQTDHYLTLHVISEMVSNNSKNTIFLLSGYQGTWYTLRNLKPCKPFGKTSWQPFCRRNENWDIVTLPLNGRIGPREQRAFVCTGKLLGSDRDSFQTFHEVLYDFPRDVSRGQRRMGNTNLALLFSLEGKKINIGEFELYPFHSEDKHLR